MTLSTRPSDARLVAKAVRCRNASKRSIRVCTTGTAGDSNACRATTSGSTPVNGEADNDFKAALGESVTQFAAFTYQAFGRVVRKAEGSLSGEGRVPEVNRRGRLAGSGGCGEPSAKSRSRAREELATVPMEHLPGLYSGMQAPIADEPAATVYVLAGPIFRNPSCLVTFFRRPGQLFSAAE